MEGTPTLDRRRRGPLRFLQFLGSARHLACASPKARSDDPRLHCAEVHLGAPVSKREIVDDGSGPFNPFDVSVEATQKRLAHGKLCCVRGAEDLDPATGEHLRRTRPRIERLLGLLVHRYGARKARYVGAAKARLQAHWAAALVNLNPIARHLLAAGT
jgi:hypothetical protein